MATRDQVKQWFRTGLYPTQAQFWELLDSILFSGEVAVADITGLVEALQAKADKASGGVELLFNADGYFDLPQGNLLEMVIPFLGANSSIFSLGTTNGGGELLAPTDRLASDETPIVVMAYARNAARRIYVNGIPLNSSILFVTRKINL